MRIGSSIGLMAVGLVLALAIHVRLGGIDLNLIGWILVAVGVIGLAASLVMVRQTRPVVERDVVHRSDVAPRATVYDERL